MKTAFEGYLATPRTIWLTGASSGIGRELACQLAEAGHRVITTARNQDALAALAAQYPQQLVSLPLDLTDDAALAHARTRLAVLAPTLDLAILNAGTCEYLDDGVIDMARLRHQMAVNFDSTVHAASVALGRLASASEPALYVVSSQVTTLPLTRAGAYGASKAALEYFFRCLRIDRRHTGLRVGIVRPGFVKTPLTDRNDFPMPFLWDAPRAAAAILQAIDRRREEITFPLSLHSVLGVLACLPHRLWAFLSQGLRKPATGSLS